MASLIGFSNPQVQVQNTTINVLPNTFKFTAGEGVLKARAVAAGGNSTVTVVTIDMSTKVGKCQFDVTVTSDNTANFTAWKSIIGALGIQATQAGFDTIVFQNMSLVNDPDWEATADGKVTLMFEGDPAISI